MDKLKEYIGRMKSWSPEAEFGGMYSNVVARSERPAFYMPSALKLSAAFAALFVILFTGFYFNSFPTGTAYRTPVAYIFEQEAQAGDGPISYIFSE
jgi:hypothetical protein